MNENRNIVVIGASAGGFQALQKLFSQLPAELPAALFVVLHIPANFPSMLARFLNNAGPLTAKAAADGEPIQLGHIYVAPPNHHLLVKEDHIRLSKGPQENRHRPAIDPLFRSAAASHQSRVICVLLSGLLDDGTSGLLAIKRCGGIAVVQDPEDADYPDMPRNAIATVEVDYQLPVHEIGGIIQTLVNQEANTVTEVPPDIQREVQIAERLMDHTSNEGSLGHLVPLSCPECGGPLWQIDADGINRYRCQVGHGFTTRALLASQDIALEQALWAAMRMMEQRARISKTMAEDEIKQNRHKSAQRHEEQANLLKSHVQMIRNLLLSQGESAKNTP